MPIKRDAEGFTRQHNAHYPEQFDAGDSCRSDGLLAMAGNSQSREVVTEFWVIGPKNKSRVVRHPFDPKWSKSELTSRDQVISLTGGLRARFRTMAKDAITSYAIYHAMKHEADTWFVNKDIKLPHYRLAMYRSIYKTAPILIGLFGYPLLLLHVLTSLWDKKSEVNQTISMLSCFPAFWMRLFCKIRGNVGASLDEYWGGYPWRDQQEISNQIKDYLKVNLKCKI